MYKGRGTLYTTVYESMGGRTDRGRSFINYVDRQGGRGDPPNVNTCQRGERGDQKLVNVDKFELFIRLKFKYKNNFLNNLEISVKI